MSWRFNVTIQNMHCLLPAMAIIDDMVSRALHEDIGSGDVTAALLPPAQLTTAAVIAREAGIVCGRVWFERVFAQLDPQIRIAWHRRDGEPVHPEQIVCELHGPARPILSGERVALNFLQTLSGTASLTRQYVLALTGTTTRLLDTRKTLPLWRHAQKYAVCCGGGHNHRMGLYDMILIKENHIAAAGSVTAALQQAQQTSPSLPLEIEVETLAQLHEALQAGATRILLDNMDTSRLRECVQLTAGRAQLEASGNVTLATIQSIAQTGVDFISVGSITKHLHALDLSLRLRPLT
jgi:nicotinate-nucleotide pyrophosphorylase (carboxylating)